MSSQASASADALHADRIRYRGSENSR
jgi:hypothetical protein